MTSGSSGSARDLPPFQTTSRPWFGPTKRAQEALRHRQHVATPEQALGALVAALGPYGDLVQRVRFIDFRHRERRNFRFTIALTWTASSPETRQAIYDLGPSFAKDHGWYPLVQGSRIDSKQTLNPKASRLRSRQPPQLDVPGRLRSIASAVTPDGGCSIRVHTGEAALLLDAGNPGKLEPSDDDRLVVLSHVHRDHSGGVTTVPLTDRPLVTTQATALSLLQARIVDEDDLRNRLALAEEGRRLALGSHLSIEAFPVPHCPGSSGYALRDEQTSLFYTGDICLATARHDFLAPLVDRVAQDPAAHKTVLLDATMAGRQDGASGQRAAQAVRTLLGEVSDVVLCAQDASQLIYAHLDLFATLKNDPASRTTTSTLITPRARPLMRLLHTAFIDRSVAQLDPLIAAQYRTSMSAWAESRWLYWLDELSDVPQDTAGRIWLVTPDELHRAAGQPGVVAYIGRRPETTPTELPETALDTSPWTQHSDAVTIDRAVRELSGQADVVLFHQFPRKLNRFIEQRGLPRCAALTQQPIDLIPRSW